MFEPILYIDTSVAVHQGRQAHLDPRGHDVTPPIERMKAMKPEQLALPGFTPSSKPPLPESLCGG